MRMSNVPLPRPGPIGLIQYAGVDMQEYAAAVSASKDAEIERLRAELAECRRDAERYRWLRSESCPWPGVFSIEGADDYGWYAICEGDLDQAIDDALAAKEKVK